MVAETPTALICGFGQRIAGLDVLIADRDDVGPPSRRFLCQRRALPPPRQLERQRFTERLIPLVFPKVRAVVEPDSYVLVVSCFEHGNQMIASMEVADFKVNRDWLLWLGRSAPPAQPRERLLNASAMAAVWGVIRPSSLTNA
jgi:hypothetical protein